MIDVAGAKLLAVIFRIDVLLEANIALRKVENISVRVVRAIGSIRTNGRTLQGRQFGVEFLHPRDGILDIVHLDAEMIQSAGAAVAPRNMSHPHITVAKGN